MLISTEKMNEITNALISANNGNTVKVSKLEKGDDIIFEIKITGLNKDDFFSIIDLAAGFGVERKPGEARTVVEIEKMTDERKAKSIAIATTGRRARGVSEEQKADMVRKINASEYSIINIERTEALAKLLANAKAA